MQLFNKKSRAQRLLDTVTDSFDLPTSSSRPRLRGLSSGSGLTDRLSTSNAVKAGVVAGSMAGLTAASAGISALRRAGRRRDDS